MWTEERVCNHNRAVNWPKVAETLKNLRAMTGQANASAFARDIKIDKSTVGRIEEGVSKPDLLTIEKWVTACGGRLSAFFLQIESGTTSAVELRHASDPVSIEDAERFERFARAMLANASNAVATARATQSIRDAGRKKSGRGRGGT